MGTGEVIRGIAAAAAMRAAAVLTGLTVAAATTGAAWAVQDVALSSAARPVALTIEGSIAGVRAGAPAAPLRLTLRNAGHRPAHVTRVAARSTGVARGPAACDARFLRITDWTGRTTVPPGGSATVTLRVAVDERLAPECGTVAWRLAYTAY